MSIINNYITYNTVRDIRKVCFDKLMKLPVKYIDSNAHGGIVSRIITDVDTFADGLLMGFTQVFTGIATIIGTLIFMIMILSHTKSKKDSHKRRKNGANL